MDESYTAKSKDMTYEAAFESYKKLYVKNEKEFIQLIMIQGMNNVTEVVSCSLKLIIVIISDKKGSKDIICCVLFPY